MTDPRQVSAPHARIGPGHEAADDPLRLCVLATVAVLSWLLGPVAVVGFAVLGAVGYGRARRAGLLHSRCKLGDTRVVIAYLVVLAAVGVAGCVWALTGTHLGL